jgi:hypothetical protein
MSALTSFVIVVRLSPPALPPKAPDNVLCHSLLFAPRALARMSLLNSGILRGNSGHAKAARRLLRRLLKKQGLTPKRIVTDKLGSYGAARREVMPTVEHRSHKPSASSTARTRHAGLPIPGRSSTVRLHILRCPQSLRSASLSPLRSSRPLHRLRALTEWKAVAGVAA